MRQLTEEERDATNRRIPNMARKLRVDTRIIWRWKKDKPCIWEHGYIVEHVTDKQVRIGRLSGDWDAPIYSLNEIEIRKQK